MGNYLALELQTELRRHDVGPNEYLPGLSLQWGMQRRLGRHFLLDLNAGIGLESGRSSYYSSGGWNSPPTYQPGSSWKFHPAYQLNFGLYFGH